MATPAVETAPVAPATTEPSEKTLLAPSAPADTTSSAPLSTVDSKSIREGASTPAPESGPRKTPFAFPEPSCKPAAPAALTAEQQTKYDELLKTAQGWTEIPSSSAKNAEKAALSNDEKMWLTRECLLRYLRASKWNLAHATTRLLATLTWRREYGTDTFTADYISEENATGKQVILGYDNEGRPCLYLLPQNQNTKNSPKQVEHLVFMLEKTLEIAPPGQETLALLIDFRNSSSGSNPSLGTSKQVLHILQNHYPERLGRALITHLPWYVTTFLKLVSPFIDPVTKTKMRYNEPLETHIPPSQLLNNSGGTVDFKYDHEVYWPALNELADQRMKERRQRWKNSGGHIGESEVFLKGGEEGSLFAGEGKKEEVEGAALTEGVQGLSVKEGEA